MKLDFLMMVVLMNLHFTGCVDMPLPASGVVGHGPADQRLHDESPNG